jgi:hypothetical protein
VPYAAQEFAQSAMGSGSEFFDAHGSTPITRGVKASTYTPD